MKEVWSMRHAPWMLAAALLLSACSVLVADKGGDDSIKAKAAELAPADSPAPARLIALHRFVRDEIRQIPSEYG